jgi:hypothetical protein
MKIHISIYVLFAISTIIFDQLSTYITYESNFKYVRLTSKVRRPKGTRKDEVKLILLARSWIISKSRCNVHRMSPVAGKKCQGLTHEFMKAAPEEDANVCKASIPRPSRPRHKSRGRVGKWKKKGACLAVYLLSRSWCTPRPSHGRRRRQSRPLPWSSRSPGLQFIKA